MQWVALVFEIIVLAVVQHHAPREISHLSNDAARKLRESERTQLRMHALNRRTK